MLRISCCFVACLISASGVFAQPVPAYPPPLSQEPEVVGEVFAASASVHGSVVFVGGGTRLLSGSTVAAGIDIASVRLTRGGELRICPQTSVGVNASAARELMLSLSAGAMEAQYAVSASTDTIVTPDFRILLAGPGQFQIAVASDFRGNACVKSLAGSSAAVVVSELMGNGSYEVKPGEQVYFSNGSVAEATSRSLVECGCPGERSVLRAAESATESPSAPSLETTELEPAEPLPTLPLPASEADDVHVQVDAPLVFSAREPEPEPGPEPSSIAGLKPLEMPAVFADILANSAAVPPVEVPVATKVKKRRGFFARIGGLFAAMFSGK